MAIKANVDRDGPFPIQAKLDELWRAEHRAPSELTTFDSERAGRNHPSPREAAEVERERQGRRQPW
jgi:low affinity Fe/Cu permease